MYHLPENQYYTMMFPLLLCLVSTMLANPTPNQADAPEGRQGGGAAAAVAIDEGIKLLNDLSEYYYENAGLICWWNDWQARDQRSRIEKTYHNGRFSHEKRYISYPRPVPKRRRTNYPYIVYSMSFDLIRLDRFFFVPLDILCILCILALLYRS